MTKTVHKIRGPLLAFLIFPALLLAACSVESGASRPEAVVEAYFEALVDKDETRMVSLSCASWEQAARLELDSFAGAPASLEGLQCEVAGQEGGFTVVSCQGSILVTYGDEDQTLSLEGIRYKAIFEAGEWRFCGF